jgi:DNA-binding transcriptional LysR family regulator
MDTWAIRTFVKVSEAQSFSKAAELLFLTQPAVSKRVAALEAELGALLFDRIGKQIVLTEAGRELFPRAKRILLELDDSQRAIGNLSDKVAGRLSFGTSHHIGLHRLPAVLRRYSTTFPEVELDIRFLDSETACAAVEHGDLEMALVTLPNLPVPNILMTPVWEDPLCAVAGNSHPLAVPTGWPLDLARLASYPAILPGSGTFTRELIEAAFLKRGFTLVAKLSTNYLETIKMLVTVGLGWSILPSTMIGGGELTALPVQGLFLSRSLGVVRHERRTLSNAAREMLAMLAHPKRGR